MPPPATAGAKRERAAMGMRTDVRIAATVLPLATGLLIVGINAVVPASGGALLGLLIVLTLGAVLPAHPWRTGAIAAAPLVVAGVATVAGDSAGALMLVAASPVLIALVAAALRAGAMLAAPASDAKAGARR